MEVVINNILFTKYIIERISSRFLEWMQWIFEENCLPTVTRAVHWCTVLFTIIITGIVDNEFLGVFVHCERVSYFILISHPPHKNFVLTDTSQLMCHSDNHNNYQGCSKKWKIKISVILAYKQLFTVHKNAYSFPPIANACNIFFFKIWLRHVQKTCRNLYFMQDITALHNF